MMSLALLFPSPFPLSLFFIFSFILHVPMLLGGHDYRYTNCSSTFDCGRINGVTYPFWGRDRPSYCGHPDFQLDCMKEDESHVQIYSVYDVLDIDQTKHVVRFVRKDIWNDICGWLYVNTSLNFNVLQYAPRNVNLTLFYHCPPILNKPEVSVCKQDGVPKNEGFHFAFSSETDQIQAYRECQVCIVVPVLQEAIQRRNFDPATVQNATIVEDLLREGFDVEYDGNVTYCAECENSGGRCGYDWILHHPICFCSYGPEQIRCSVKGTNIGKKVSIGVISAIGVAILGVIVLLYYKKGKSRKLMFLGETTTTRNFEQFIKHKGSFAPKRYSFKEIKKMTQSFKSKLGQGGYGSVFKGVLNDGMLVAVKVLSDIKGNGEEFINEVASISRTSHVNIVSLLGYCFDGSKRALVYEYMPNGSLEKYIYYEDSSVENSNLGWATLLNISIGIARGLEYLHRGCNTRILHFDIKPHNILLDQDFCPKISDFGLAKLCPRKDSIISMLGARGTAGYIAPEVFCRNFGCISHKSDVYSYGMMILEMVGGRKNISLAVDHTSEIYFPHWVHKRIELNEDLGLHGVVPQAEEDIPRKMILVGLWCIQTNPFDRPAMSRVLEMLEGSLEVLEIPPKPYLSSPSRLQGDSNMS